MQTIEEKTDGSWRPGPGTVYPLLKSLVREGLVKASEKTSRTSRVSYSITRPGERELEEMRKAIASFGRKERVMMRLVVDLLPPAALVQILLGRAREGVEILRSKVMDLPDPERTAALKELVLLSEAQLEWAKGNVAAKAGLRRR